MSEGSEFFSVLLGGVCVWLAWLASKKIAGYVQNDPKQQPHKSVQCLYLAFAIKVIALVGLVVLFCKQQLFIMNGKWFFAGLLGSQILLWLYGMRQLLQSSLSKQ